MNVLGNWVYLGRIPWPPSCCFALHNSVLHTSSRHNGESWTQCESLI